jgi:glycogen phosphorylase
MKATSSGVFLSEKDASSSRSNLEGHKKFRPEFYGSGSEESRNEKLWELMAEYIDSDIPTIQSSIVSHVEYTLSRTRFNFDRNACYRAAAFSIRDRLIESWNDTQQLFTAEDYKRVYYMSLEFLMGRSMKNALVNLNLENRYRDALEELGYKLEELYEEEVDPGLGNGGLGRLAACFLDSLATLDYPAWGYGIRYDYGIFRQKILKGYQVEMPDYWLAQMNPWEIERSDVSYDIHFGGRVEKKFENGVETSIWHSDEIVRAVAYDSPIPGYDTFNTINLRLWKARPTNEFDFQSFNQGDYFKAIEARQRAEYITSVLYPNDSTHSGKELRLKQQYFFCSATIQDVIRRFLKKSRKWEELPDKIAIQLNDTHPAIAIPELLRILVDLYGVSWQKAWNLSYKIFSYTNHTVMPEALEKWGVDLIGRLLPRHLEIIYLINHIFMEQVSKKYHNSPNRYDLMSQMSLVEENNPKMIRMANLCVVASHAVNGVASIHTGLLKQKLFKHFDEYFEGKISNKTNGVTPRRWIHCSNPELSALWTKLLGSYSWLTDLDKLKKLLPEIENPELRQEFAQIKLRNKQKFALWIKQNCNIEVNTNALFDVQVKRIHEYKRQHLFALYMIHRYITLKEMPYDKRINVVKRVFMVGGKAAPGYIAAKKIIKLISSIGDLVNNDPDIGDLMKVVFLPNYNVSNAQIIIPGTDLSEQISTAGTEASGTSNMKFVMNGAVIIGTLDGANVEIVEEVGIDNAIIFGAKVDEVDGIRHKNEPAGSRLKRCFDYIRSGRIGNPKELGSLVDTIENNDFYILKHDFYLYLQAQEKADKLYSNQEQWLKMTITGALTMGKFSSDRTINEYAAEIWDIERVKIPAPGSSALSRVRSQPNLVPIDSHQEKIKKREAVFDNEISEDLLENTLAEPKVPTD